MDAKDKISPWIPLIRDGLKWLVIVVMFFHFKDTVNIINERMLGGSSIKIGSGGLELGAAPILESGQKDVIAAAVERFDESPMAFSTKQAPLKGAWKSQKPFVLENVLGEAFYMVHAAQKKSEGVYEIIIGIGTHYEGAKDKIDHVVYRLHESFEQKNREIQEPGPKKDFPLKITAWGQFEAKAEIHLKGSSEPIKVSRFLNF